MALAGVEMMGEWALRGNRVLSNCTRDVVYQEHQVITLTLKRSLSLSDALTRPDLSTLGSELLSKVVLMINTAGPSK